MEMIQSIFAIILVSLKVDLSSAIRRISTVTKLPNNTEQNFKSSLGIDGFMQWQVNCGLLSSDVTVKNCEFSLGVISMEKQTTLWKNYNFQMKMSSKDSVIVPDYLKTYRLEKSNFLVTWIEFDIHSNKTIPHVDGTNLTVGLFVNFATIDLQNETTGGGSTTGTSMILRKSNPKDKKILFLREFVESIDIMIFDKEFEIRYPYTYPYKNNKTRAREIFRFDGCRSHGPVKLYARKSKVLEKHACSMTKYPENNNDLISQERILYNQAGLCNEIFCDPGNFENRNRLCACSTANGNTTACFHLEFDTFECEQRNQNGQFGREPIFIEILSESKSLMVYSMHNGDVLVMNHVEKKIPIFHTVHKHNQNQEKHDVANDYELFNVYRLTKFDFGSDRGVNLTFAEFRFEISGVLGNFFEDAGESCGSILWINQTFLGREIMCLTDENLNGELRNVTISSVEPSYPP
ncbi:hypothetical protein QAD02_006526 [Eretmocerus hayati]|uniref:Uncharacterized protein n=1 Tax=Eretmocerus hayati TaxID=131215 RepID=A0ACC2N3G4_9HYME|nr:hypothetical protein QAD02_006526 [Eretmocerus hayati]